MQILLQWIRLFVYIAVKLVATVLVVSIVARSDGGHCDKQQQHVAESTVHRIQQWSTEVVDGHRRLDGMRKEFTQEVRLIYVFTF